MKVKEIERLKTVLSYNLLDTPAEQDMDRLAELISLVCEVPIAIISLIDDKRQWYMAKVGVDNAEVPIEDSFCQFTLIHDEYLEIPEVQSDERVKNKPAAQGPDGLKFYAGLPLKAPNGQNIGTVCVASTEKHILSEKQQKSFKLLAQQAMDLMEAKKKNRKLGWELETIIEKQHKLHSERLKQKESEINALLQAISLSSGVVQFSPKGFILQANEIFAGYMGYHLESLVGKHHSKLLFKEDLSKNKEFWKNLNSGEFKSGQMKRKHKSGKEVWILATYNPILDEKGEVLKVIKIAQEITKSIESRKQLQRAKERADQLNIQKDQFIANVSHEIRTPIHAILGFTQLLLESETDTVKLEQLNAVKSAGDNLLFVVNDILDLSKIESGLFQIESLDFNLHQSIQEVSSFLQLKADQKNLDFGIDLDQDVPVWVKGDKNRLAQILINLIGNAIKFTESGSVQLKVECFNKTEQETVIRFRVIDSGIGIPMEKLAVIFDRFSQGDEKISRKFGGTGLGLNISKSLVEKMNGTIEVSSKEGRGTEFLFTIPFPKSNGLIVLNHDPVQLRTQSKPIRILLCEDNELNQILVKTILQAPHFDLSIAASGVEGIQLFREREFDLVLMDIQMPVMDGYQTTYMLREEIKTTIPIVALSANYLIKEKQKCLDAGMNDYLGKPFKKEELFEKIIEWTQQDDDFFQKKENMGSKKLEEPVDLNILREFSDGNEAFEQEMIRMFLDQIREWLNEIAQLIDLEDFKAIKASSHKFKSSFGVLGADGSGLMEMQEWAAKEDIDKIKIVHERITRYLNRVAPFLESKLKD